MWAATDFTVANGATRLIPGSHKWPKERAPEVGQTVVATMKSGSCLIYRGSVLHGGGANSTNKGRMGAVISYGLGWLKQAENFFLSVPWKTAQHFPEPLLRLMGYQLHRPNIGWVEGRDPLDWLREGSPATGSAKDALTDEQASLSSQLVEHPELFEAYLS